MKKIASLLITFLFLAAFCVSTTHADTAAAQEVWNKNCKKCHAEDGSGDTKIGQKMGLKNYTDAAVQEKMTDEVILTAIKEGASVDGKQKMKGYEGKLTEDEINDLLALVRSFGK